MNRIREIKKRLSYAQIASFWDDVDADLVYKDIPYLLAEIDRLTLTPTKIIECVAREREL